MHEQLASQTRKQTDGQTDREIHINTREQTDRETHRQLVRCIDRQMFQQSRVAWVAGSIRKRSANVTKSSMIHSAIRRISSHSSALAGGFCHPMVAGTRAAIAGVVGGGGVNSVLRAPPNSTRRRTLPNGSGPR